MSKLAINGGNRVRTKPFPAYKVIGKEEQMAAIRVIESGVLSKYLGTWHKDFFGGSEVQALEKEWAAKFNVKHAISVNSATSALYCAVGAAGVGPGDEVIVSPYTMAASATAALVYNSIPVFADVEEDYYCLSVESVREKITTRTKAIIVVDIFGQSYDVEGINALAEEFNLIVIEDCAQAPGGMYKEKFTGTLGDMGIYSLNYHKHIHTGEGGIVVTDNDDLADKLRLIRNHAEVVVGKKGYSSLVNMIGFNYRMTEVEAAMAREQLKKLDQLVADRIDNVKYFESLMAEIPCLEMPKTRKDSKHVYYLHAMKFNAELAGISRKCFVDAVKAELAVTEMREDEGVGIGCGYVRPIYMEPIYKELIGFGENGCPFKCPMYNGKINYDQGICPTVEKLHFEKVITHEYIRPSLSRNDIYDVYLAFKKVWNYREELK